MELFKALILALALLLTPTLAFAGAIDLVKEKGDKLLKKENGVRPIPEPSAALVMAVGLVTACSVSRRRQ